MPGVSGSELKYAIKKATTWGTAVACGAGDGFLALPASVRRDAPIEVDDSLGLFWSQSGTPGGVKVEGDIPLYLRYDGCDLLLSLFMGTAGVPTTHAGGTNSKDYAYTLADLTDGLFATFARHYKNYVSEIPGLKVSGLTLKGETGKPLQLIAKVIGDNAVQDGVNTTGTFASVTIAETSHRIHFAQGVFRMNAQAGAALSSGDVIRPSSFELTATRKLSGTYGGRVTAGANPQDLIDEPGNDGMPEVTLKLQFPRHTAKTRLTELGGDTRQKLDITFTGAIIEGAIPRLFVIQLPHLQIKSVDVVDEAGNIKEPVEFIAHGCAAAPSGMTGVTKPFKVTGTNSRATNPLA